MTGRIELFFVTILFCFGGCDDTSNPENDADVRDSDVSDSDTVDADDDTVDGDVSDADADQEPETCDPFESWPSGTDGASDLTLPPASGGAVAGRITSEGQLLRGLKPKGRIGDYLIGNSRVAFIIEDARPSDGYSIHGGEILDIDLVDDEGPRGLSLFNEMFQGILPEVVAPDEVSVIADGSDGEAAVVRIIGRLGPTWVIGGFGEGLFPSTLEFPVMLDYILEPEAEGVRIELTIRNDSMVRQFSSGFLTVMLGGDGLVRYAPTVGFDEEENFGTQEYVGLVGERISYAWVPTDGALQNLLSFSGVHLYNGASPALPACEDTFIELGELLVAGGDTTQMEAAIRRAQEQEPLPAIMGIVTDGEGAPVELARVHATNAEGDYLGMARTNEAGEYRLELAPGDVLVEAWAEGRRPSEAISVTLDEAGSDADLTLGATGTIAWIVRDDEGNEIPAKVSVVPLNEAAPTAPATFGEATHPNGAMIHDFSLPGWTEWPIAAGNYRVVASRGYEYEIHELDVEIIEGERAELEFTLDHSVDTTGWMCGDFHVHTMYSPDSSDIVNWKVAGAAGVGLELPVSTDHRYVSDLQPIAEELGLDSWLRWFPGHEITTFTYGHFNAYPLPVRADLPNQGAIEFLGLDAPALFESVREVSTDPILQINHPRTGRADAYFDHVGLDPTDLSVERTDEWSLNFDAVEVFNDSGWTDNRESTILDWFGLLENGHLITATGNSDSHVTEWHDVGYPRTYLLLDNESPSAVTGDMIRDTIRARTAVISGGHFITVVADGDLGPGDLVAVDGGETTVRVVIQAPTWIDADFAEIIVNGETVETITLGPETEDPENPVVRLNREIDVLLDADGWLVIGSWADGRLTPVTPGGQPFGATNAIFFDTDGDGLFRGQAL